MPKTDEFENLFLGADEFSQFPRTCANGAPINILPDLFPDAIQDEK